MSKKNKKTIKKWLKKANALRAEVFNFGDMSPEKSRILVLILAIVFMSTYMLISDILTPEDLPEKNPVPIQTKRNVALENKIDKMVEGYPIENMTTYIADQDPRVAAFLIAIAKKESAWGKRSPVLAGRDCFNYWGFRLKTESMGSGGHTCFDSPKEAVDAVAERITEMVNVEKIDSAKEMVVWKCGYGCQNQTKTTSENKWIQDVNYYYQNFSEYL